MSQGWYWLLLILALLAFGVQYIPAQTLALLDADVLIPHGIFQDVFREGHSLRDWHFGGALFLFPDFICTVFLDFLTGNALKALEWWFVLCHVALIVLLVAGYAVLGGKRVEIFLLLALLIELGALSVNLIPNVHYGTLLMTLAAFALTMRLWSVDRSERLYLLFLLGGAVFLGALSDSLLVVSFSLPMVGALVLETVSFPPKIRRNFRLIGVIAISTILGNWLYPRIGIPMESSHYVSFKSELILTTLHVVWNTMVVSGPCWARILFCADIIAVVILVPYMAKGLFSAEGNSVASPWFVTLAFSCCVIVVGWGSVLCTGIFLDLTTCRYVTLPLLLPPLLLAGFLCETIRWGEICAPLFSCGLACILGVLILHPPAPGNYWSDFSGEYPALKALMEREHIDGALADYWHANLITYLSDKSVVVRQISNEGRVWHWFNNIRWYTGFGSAPKPPEFRLVLMDGLNPEAIRKSYGSPDKIEKIAGNHEAWIYFPEHAIRYNPLFGDLEDLQHCSPDRPTQYHDSLVTRIQQTGHLEKGWVTLRSGTDSPGELNYGPCLRVQPGRYRLEFAYSLVSLPTHDKIPFFLTVIGEENKEDIVHRTPLPSEKTGAGTITREVTIPPSKALNCVLAGRLIYLGSGELQIGGLTVTRLEEEGMGK